MSTKENYSRESFNEAKMIKPDFDSRDSEKISSRTTSTLPGSPTTNLNNQETDYANDKEVLGEQKQKDRHLSPLDQFGFIINENWTNKIMIDAIITDITNDKVFCECLIDIDRLIFQERIFDKNLFANFNILKIDQPVLLKINSRPGSIRFEILEGTNIVDTSVFETKKSLEGLDEAGLNNVIDDEITF